MAGVAGAVIGLTSGIQTAIGGTARVAADGSTSSRGCLNKFIGFGLGLSNVVQTQASGVSKDFNTPEDRVTLGRLTPVTHYPLYTGDVLTWPV